MLPRLPVAVPLAASAALAALAALVLVDWAPLVGWDSALSVRARAFGHDHPAWVATLRVLTDVAATIPFLAIGGALTVGFVLLRRYVEAAATGLVTALAPLAWGLAHAWLHRPRPADGFVAPDSNGFPSGHTANATSLALLGVLLLWPRMRRTGRALAVVGAVLVTGFIGLTRVALLAHWPSDVVGGALLGLAVVPLCVAAACAAAACAGEPSRSGGD